MSDSRISGFYKLSVDERISALQSRGWLSAADAAQLRAGRQVLSVTAADRIIENVVGVFGLPFAIAPNFLVDDREYIVPLVVEEPSIVAGLSDAARIARAGGGFRIERGDSLLIGQVHVTDMADIDTAVQSLHASRPALLAAANAVHPRLAERGGGVAGMELRTLSLPGGRPLLVVHLLVDTVDAMGANLVNTICEAVAPEIARLCGGHVALRILSNLADRALVTAAARFAVGDLARGPHDGAAVRDAIVLANDIARVDAHRAATHNKGIMNGVDALAIATGNDWRAVGAGAHAYAARNGSYQPLTRWSVDDQGDLVGELTMPLKLGTVGGTLGANPAASLGLAITGVGSATELAGLTAAVGLAQNLAALRALASTGIQEGHMKLHARSVAAAAGAPESQFDTVVAKLIDSGEIKHWKAEEIVRGLQGEAAVAEPLASAAGKVILLGEHAAVYGRHALALPIPDALRVYADHSADTTRVVIPRWRVDRTVEAGSASGLDAAIESISRQLGVDGRHFSIHIDTELPAGMGLGSSAAIAVGVARALAALHAIDADDERINAIAFECEKLAHGQPSGIDNTISVFAKPMLFRNAGELELSALELETVPPLVIAYGTEAAPTREQVAGVRSRYERAPERYGALFDEIDKLSVAGAELLQSENYDELGLLMNVCQGLLNAIEVSTPALEKTIALARQAGAVGAKLTGGGGGGSIVALCPGSIESVDRALRAAGHRTLVLS